MSSEQQRDEPLLVRPQVAFDALGIGRSKGYSLIAQGRLAGVVSFGPRCTRVNLRVLREWIDSQSADSEQGESR